MAIAKPKIGASRDSFPRRSCHGPITKGAHRRRGRIRPTYVTMTFKHSHRDAIMQDTEIIGPNPVKLQREFGRPGVGNCGWGELTRPRSTGTAGEGWLCRRLVSMHCDLDKRRLCMPLTTASGAPRGVSEWELASRHAGLLHCSSRSARTRSGLPTRRGG